MDIYDAMNMSYDEYIDRMAEEYKKSSSYKEIVGNSGKTAEELAGEITSFNRKFLDLISKYELSLKNKVLFILELVKLKENRADIMPLLSCFICSPEYMFHIKGRKISSRSYSTLAKYLALKNDMQLFEKYYKNVESNGVKYNNLLEKIKIEKNNCKLDMTPNTKKLLCGLYNKYISSKKQPLIENIEHIHKFAMASEAGQELYPLLVFQCLVKYKAKIPEKPFLINPKNVLNYKNYTAVEEDNGKNFKTYGDYISLFLDLIDNFSSICNVEVCMYGFEKCSNLVKWLFKNTLYKDSFHHSICSLVQSTYGSVFYEESMLWKESEGTMDFKGYADFHQIDNCNGNFLLSKIQNKISVDNVLIIKYLNEYAKGREYGLSFVKKLARNIFNIGSYRTKKNGMGGYLYLMVEGEIQSKADNLIKDNIVNLLSD